MSFPRPFLRPTAFCFFVYGLTFSLGCNSGDPGSAPKPDSANVSVLPAKHLKKRALSKTQTDINDAEYRTPDSFLGLHIGMPLSLFIQKYPDAHEGTFWVLMTRISAKGMKVLTVERNTSSGDVVQIDCCFYMQKLSIISIEYKSYQVENTLLTALQVKYGPYSRIVKEWNDFTNQQDRTTSISRWDQYDSYILEFDYTRELGLAEIIYADRHDQVDLAKAQAQVDKRKIE